MRKIYYVTTFMIILLISYLGITYSFSYGITSEMVTFSLNGPKTLYIDVNSKYEEFGATAYSMGNSLTDEINIDSSMVNVSKIGKYKVKYEVVVNGIAEYIYRDVIVIDKSSPVIKLKGDSIVYVLLNGSYYEEGYTVTDNYDKDLESKVTVDGKVNLKKEGTYTLNYSVYDSSGNKASASRTVIVKKSEVTLASLTGNRYNVSKYDHTRYSNTIIANQFNSNGIYYEGYVKEKSSLYKIKLKDVKTLSEYIFNMTVSKNNYYKGNLDLTTVKNGEYEAYIIGKTEDKLLNKLDGLTRLLRAKVGNKLVSLEYKNDAVKIIISDFAYEYDVVIDPGHGGSDIGAGNGLTAEKAINLKQSLYEKCRYESMGYKVFLTRYDDTLGIQLGDSSLLQLQRRALAIGYYGAVSRVAYSNHHNGSKDSGAHGFEIIVPNSADDSSLVLEMSLYSKYKKYYNINSGVRLYSKNYDTDVIYNKSSGRVYDYKNYYAVIRIPYELFNVKTVIYEPIYMSNDNDFNWYWTNKKWIQVTEMKIEEYVNYMGGTYNKDNSSCL